MDFWGAGNTLTSESELNIVGKWFEITVLWVALCR